MQDWKIRLNVRVWGLQDEISREAQEESGGMDGDLWEGSSYYETQQLNNMEPVY